MINPWDIPPVLPVGNQSADEIYTSVGRALSAWEQLEEFLGALFTTLCQTRSLGPSLAYGAVAAHSARNDMLKAAAHSRGLPKDDRARTMKMFEHIGKLAGRRNDIAHGSVIRYNPSGTRYSGHYLSPLMYQSAKSGSLSYPPTMQPKYLYTASQIDAFTAHFYEQRHNVHALDQFIRDEDLKLQQRSQPRGDQQ